MVIFDDLCDVKIPIPCGDVIWCFLLWLFFFRLSRSQSPWGDASRNTWVSGIVGTTGSCGGGYGEPLSRKQSADRGRLSVASWIQVARLQPSRQEVGQLFSGETDSLWMLVNDNILILVQVYQGSPNILLFLTWCLRIRTKSVVFLVGHKPWQVGMTSVLC